MRSLKPPSISWLVTFAIALASHSKLEASAQKPCAELAAKQAVGKMIQLGYNASIATRISKTLPELAIEITSGTPSRDILSAEQPRTLFRGLKNIRPGQFNPFLRGLNFRETWVTMESDLAMRYAVTGHEFSYEDYWQELHQLSRSGVRYSGMVIEYEIPTLMAHQGSKRVPIRDDRFGDQRPFIVRVGLVRTSSWRLVKGNFDPTLDWFSYEEAVKKKLFVPESLPN